MRNLAALQSAELTANLHYVRKAPPEQNYWFSLYRHKLGVVRAAAHDHFCVVVHGDKDDPHDFFSIPFERLAHMLTEQTLAGGKYGKNRWVGTIERGVLKMHPGPSLSVAEFRGVLPGELTGELGPPASPPDEVLEQELEDARREVAVRLRQSKFRARVMANFDGRCCITGLADTELVEAAHIVGWSEDKSLRLDPRNGLCLAVHLHRLFDLGAFVLTDELRVLPTAKLEQLSAPTQKLVREFAGYAIAPARRWPFVGRCDSTPPRKAHERAS